MSTAHHCPVHAHCMMTRMKSVVPQLMGTANMHAAHLGPFLLQRLAFVLISIPNSQIIASSNQVVCLLLHTACSLAIADKMTLDLRQNNGNHLKSTSNAHAKTAEMHADLCILTMANPMIPTPTNPTFILLELEAFAAQNTCLLDFLQHSASLSSPRCLLL